MVRKADLRRWGAPQISIAITFLLASASSAAAAQSRPDVPAAATPQPAIAASAGPLRARDLSILAHAPYPFQVNPSPPMIQAENGLLSVSAHNSDLQEILLKIGQMTGISINGEAKGRRIYGVYGPANSRDLIETLLAGSGYNFVMVGNAPDHPRVLYLTQPSPYTANRPAAAQNSDQDSEPEPDQSYSPFENSPESEPPPVEPQSTFRRRHADRLMREQTVPPPPPPQN